MFGFKMKLTVVLASITGIEQHVDSKDKDRESEIRITVKRHHDKTDLKSSTKDVEKSDKKEKHEKSYVLRFANKATMEEAYSVLDSVWRTHQPEEPTERKVRRFEVQFFFCFVLFCIYISLYFLLILMSLFAEEPRGECRRRGGRTQ